MTFQWFTLDFDYDIFLSEDRDILLRMDCSSNRFCLLLDSQQPRFFKFTPHKEITYS